MKKLILLFTVLLSSIITKAQTTTVYFGNLDSKVSVGVGIPKGMSPNVILSIMQIDKSKNFDESEFSFKCVNGDGEDININLEIDTIYHLDMDKSYSHQLDYKISRMDYGKMCQLLNNTSTTVYVNNVEYTGAAFVGILRALEHEQTMMFSGMPRTFQNMTIWNWPGRNIGDNNRRIPNIEFMRFRNPNLREKDKSKNDFRYIRRIEK